MQFLKLGGSLITDKNNPHTPRMEVIQRLAIEIAEVYRINPGLQLILGHGSGSFGHIPAKKWGTRQGVVTQDEWGGFVEVWKEANALNRLVMDALTDANLPVIAFSPVSSVLAKGGKIIQWELKPIQLALQAGLLPVIQGDVSFDFSRGGTILSTEDLFLFLSESFQPSRILLAGLEPGVWADFPACTRLVENITPDNVSSIQSALGSSAAVDVTGGMAGKVRESLAFVQAVPKVEVLVFSGQVFGTVRNVLLGSRLGTLIHS
jgi:isopentenyl phosphate kinase